MNKESNRFLGGEKMIKQVKATLKAPLADKQPIDAIRFRMMKGKTLFVRFRYDLDTRKLQIKPLSILID